MRRERERRNRSEDLPDYNRMERIRKQRIEDRWQHQAQVKADADRLALLGTPKPKVKLPDPDCGCGDCFIYVEPVENKPPTDFMEKKFRFTVADRAYRYFE